MPLTGLLIPTTTTADSPVPRRRGRPRVDLDPEKRRLHEICATARLIFRRPVDAIAHDLDVSPSTVKLWTKRALRYDGPVADALRHAVAVRQPTHH